MLHDPRSPRWHGRRWPTAALGTTLALTASACWPAAGQGPDRTGYNPAEKAFTAETIGDLAPVWTFDTGVYGFAPHVTGAVVSPGGVHVALKANDGPMLVTLDPRTGAVRWDERVEADGEFYNDPAGPPVVSDDRVYMSTLRDSLNVEIDHGTTQVFDITTGDDLCVVGAGGAIEGLRGRYVALVTRDTSSGTSGGTQYTASIGNIDSPGSRQSLDLMLPGTYPDGFGGVTVGAEMIFHTGVGTLGTQPGQAGESRAVRGYSLRGPESTACGPIGWARRLVACPEWVTPASHIPEGSAPVVHPDQSTVYVAADVEGLLALDAATGVPRWTGNPPEGGWPTRTPALANDILFVPSDIGLAAYAARGCGAATCDPLWQTGHVDPDTGFEGLGRALAQPAVAGDVVFLVVDRVLQPTLVALDADGCGATYCEPLWSDQLPSMLTGDLAISGGHLYVPTETGLIAYGL